MAQLVMIVFVCLVYLISPSSTALTEDEEYSLNMVTKAANAICWYETLKKLPPVKTFLEYEICLRHTNFTGRAPDWELSADGYDRMLVFGVKYTLAPLSGDYESCVEYLYEPTEFPKREYQPILEDKEKYKHRKFAHCLLDALEDAFGTDAISDLERLWKNRETFLTTMLDRGNEFRAFYGVPKLQLEPQLTKLAQIQAEKLVNSLEFSYLKNGTIGHNIGGCLYQDQYCGESVDYVSIHIRWLEDDEIAMKIENNWHRDHEQYMWPAYDGTLGQNSLTRFQFFSQQVWKSSQFVGYGMARCHRMDLAYVVALYWPAGNPTDKESIHLYAENVLPPKETPTALK